MVTVKPLSDVFALVRYEEDPQNFGIEYVTGIYRRYSSTDRYVQGIFIWLQHAYL